MSSSSRRPIRSYVLRQGRMTPGQHAALQELGPRYVIPAEDEAMLESYFARQAPLHLEIGFGMGQSLVQMAKAQPENNFMGIEVHQPGVGALLAEAQQQGVDNLKVLMTDAVDILTARVVDSSLAKLMVFFPDPWPKKRHQKRRLLQADFIRLMVSKLKVGGLLHMATDWQHYADEMVSELAQVERDTEIKWRFNDNSTQPLRPQTKFERRGLRLGHAITDIVVAKLA